MRSLCRTPTAIDHVANPDILVQERSMSFKVDCKRIVAERAVDHVMTVSQASSKHTAGASSYVIAQAQARFADALGLEMKAVELIPNKMAGKPEAELRGGYHLSLHLVCSSPLASLQIAYGPVCALVLLCSGSETTADV